MLRLLITLAFLAPTALCIDHEVFRNCSRVSFCATFRDKVLDEAHQFSVGNASFQEQYNSVIIPLHNAIGDTLNLELFILKDKKTRVKIFNGNHSRYQLSDVLDREPATSNFVVFDADDSIYIISREDEQFARVYRDIPFRVEFYYHNILEAVLKGDRLVVENTNSSQAFAFEVEFVADKLYGLHHHAYSLTLGETTDGSSDPFRLRNSDAAYYETQSTMALYGAVPVIYGYSVDLTSGIFLHNAAEQWVDISYSGDRPAAYFMVESGTLDLFVLLGPTIQEVVRQFTNLTGVAHLPQLWTLGYHQSRYSYLTQEDVKDIVANMNKYDFPMDSIWLDIDYTDGKKYFTWNPDTFSNPIEMQNNLSSTHKKLVTIIDPHYKVDPNYALYADANASNYFIKWQNGSNYEGECWPGTSSWIDFLNPDARNYYATWYSYEKFKGSTETLAGIWNDMNEPAIFDTRYENTIPFEVVHTGNVLHRDIHNIYGFLHTKATHQGLIERDNGTKRPFILTRSHFAGSQRYAAMWTGDNVADWPYLAISYSECLTSNLLGMVFCGADIGGFFGNPDEELLQRWYQAGVWLPFFRSHSSSDTARREPYLFSSNVQSVIREAIKLRYKHIPVWYTLFYEHTRYGQPVIRPLFYDDPKSLRFQRDDHVLLGTDILARPILEPNVDIIEVIFPRSDSLWYRVDDESWWLYAGDSLEFIIVDIYHSPYYYRAGSIIPRKDTERRSTAEMQNDSYTLYVNLDLDNNAEGRLYEDDYTSFDYATKSSYLYLKFQVAGTNSVMIFVIDGNPLGFNLTVSSIVFHRPRGLNSGTTYTTTSDGTPLGSIDIVKELSARKSNGFTLNL